MIPIFTFTPKDYHLDSSTSKPQVAPRNPIATVRGLPKVISPPYKDKSPSGTKGPKNRKQQLNVPRPVDVQRLALQQNQ